MFYIYFLTIDKVLLGQPPTKEDILQVCCDICRVADLQPISPYEVFCFESKDKGKVHGNYLHYHALLRSTKRFIGYQLIAQKGWSVKLIKMKTHIDVAVTAGYIQKLKIDRCDIIPNS